VLFLLRRLTLILERELNSFIFLKKYHICSSLLNKLDQQTLPVFFCLFCFVLNESKCHSETVFLKHVPTLVLLLLRSRTQLKCWSVTAVLVASCASTFCAICIV